MPELKRTFTGGKMNKDLDERVVPKGQYVDALNIQVNTSDDSDIGAVQTLKGNSALSSIFTSSAKCIGTIANEINDKLYWFVSDSGANAEASTDTHVVYSDYIIEYDQSELTTSQIKYIAVENYKVTTVIQTARSNTNNLIVGSALGLQVGMSVEANNTSSIISQLEQEDGFVIVTLKTNAEQLITTTLGSPVTFTLPANKRALGFSNFVDVKPFKLITGINIIDDLLFWTDGLTEPKKINIERCRYGSQQATPAVYPVGTRALPTLLIVNGDIPRSSNSVIHSSVTHSIPLTYRNTTVIRKSPTTQLVLTMANTLRTELDISTSPQNTIFSNEVDGAIIVDTTVEIPDSVNGLGSFTDFFFNTSTGNLLTNGTTLPVLVFAEDMDWKQKDLIEFFPKDEDAGNTNDVLATLEIKQVVDPRSFIFTIQSISSKVIKPFTTYRAKLKEGDPLFEFKFPRFAYRWKYEDGEYSAFSPFSEVAFLPDRFDYLPKKGFNLGMTNNLRKLIISGFKPKTTPLDVVEIDILYKESNSPNVYTVETIKSPRKKVNNVSVSSYKGDEGWFGKIEEQENPNTLATEDRLVSVNSFVSDPNTPTGQHALGDGFYSANIKEGDKVVFTGNQTAVSNLTITDINVDGYVTLSSSITTANALGTFNLFRVSAKSPAIVIEDPQGSFEVKSDMIHATLPSNQLLRPWDNVPIKALAQDVTKNRIVYGNYTQNYNLEDENGNSIKPTFDVRVSDRNNIRENVRFDDRTTLRDQDTGNTVNWYDLENRIIAKATLPERSLKSIRDYQIGIVFSDEFGRQTPVQTDKTGVIRIPKYRAERYNNLRIHLDSLHETSQGLRKPTWASHYKYYIKETSNEYYNLAMDRFYAAEDGNIWISFPSSERNKVDEETFLILKKQHDNDTFVTEDARYKILAISNEAPLFIKTKIDSFGTLSTDFPDSGEPKFQATHVDIPSSYITGSFQDVLTENERVLRISSPSNFSFYYDIATITSLGNGFHRLVVRKPFGVDMSFTTVDGTNIGNMNANLSIEVATKKVKTLPEFIGRFFVKIHKDGVFEKNILSKAPGKEYITSQTVKIGQTTNIQQTNLLGPSYDATRSAYRDHLPENTWFVSKLQPAEGDGINHALAGTSLGGITSNKMTLQIHHGAQGLSGDYGITNDSNNFNASNYNKDIAERLITQGQLFRFKGDTSIYRITSGREFQIKNYASSYNTALATYGANISIPAGVAGLLNNAHMEEAENHSVGFNVNFVNALDTQSPDGDAVNLEHTGYDPRFENKEGSTTASYGVSVDPETWQGAQNNDWGLNIATRDAKYHEASQCYAVDREFNAYENKLEATSFWTSWNATNYYNCFSFGNGVESNRIRDDFNTPTIDKGPKVSTVLAEQYREENRKSGLIYSGLYNSTSGVNNLNQFIMAEKITKDLNPTYGSIQKLYANETNLISLCEDRIIRILANKDALFNADGNSNITSTNNVLGNATPYSGDYGISTNPESFAVDQYRSYFTDVARGKVIRLSKDGITSISDFGMSDYFKDSFNIGGISLIGSFDEDKGFYNLSIGSGTSKNTTVSATVSFSEKVKGWVTFQSWQQETGVSFNSKYYTFNKANLYVHHDNETRNNFYGVDYDSSICLMFNDAPGSVKSFSSLSYEGTQSKIDEDISVDSNGNSIDNQYYNSAAVAGWYAESIETDLETGYIPEFKNKEGKWFNFIRGNQDNTLENLDVQQFSTQGIGMLSTSPSAVNDDGSNGEDKQRFRFTIQDLGDND